MRFTRILAVAGVVVTLACSGSPSGPSGSEGTMNVRITDSPFGSAKAVLVTFSEVSAQRDGGGWSKLPFAGSAGSRTCDLKKLENSAEDVLGTGAVEAGSYNMLRLTIEGARIYFDNNAVSSTPCAPAIAAPAGSSYTLTIPSREVKLNGQFNVSAGGATTVLLDFDGASSIIQTGNNSYTMNPVVRILSVQ